MPRLFRPFVQLDSRLNREHSGTGLGLALVHQLAKLHGGSIALESTGVPGEGSRFTISLPWQPPPDTPPAPHSPAQRPAEGVDTTTRPSPGQGARILLADDNPITLNILADALKAHGYPVAVAHNGIEALAQVRAFNPQLILLDVQMPGLDGLEVIRQLRSAPTPSSVPIIAVTALAMPGDRERCLEAGANDYLSKPVVLKKLYKAVETQLEQAYRQSAA